MLGVFNERKLAAVRSNQQQKIRFVIVMRFFALIFGLDYGYTRGFLVNLTSKKFGALRLPTPSTAMPAQVTRN